MPLNGKQKRRLRALGHHLSVVVQVGANGVTDGVIAAAAQALKDHELIKVKIADDREGRSDAIDALVKGTGAEVAQTLGRTVLLFKKRAKKSKFESLFAKAVEAPAAAPAPAELAEIAEDDSDDLPVDEAFVSAEALEADEADEAEAHEVDEAGEAAEAEEAPVKAKRATASRKPASKKPASKRPASKKPAARKPATRAKPSGR